EHALRSMAQTRATSKALGQALRFIVALSGYEGTPAEEMPVEEARPSDSFRQPKEKTPKAPKEEPKEEEAAPAPEAPPQVTGEWTGLVERVSYREYDKKDAQGRKTGEKGKTYSIVGERGKTFKTWSDSFAKDAKYAAENGERITIRYEETEYRGAVEYKAIDV